MSRSSRGALRHGAGSPAIGGLGLQALARGVDLGQDRLARGGGRVRSLLRQVRRAGTEPVPNLRLGRRHVPGRLLAEGTTLLHVTTDPEQAARAPMGDALIADPTAVVRALRERVTPSSRTVPDRVMWAATAICTSAVEAWSPTVSV